MIIKPKRHWFDINLKELRVYRDLIALFVEEILLPNINKPFSALYGSLFNPC